MQVLIEPSTTIRRKYDKIAKICWEYGVPVFLSKNGKGDLVAVSIEHFFRQEGEIELRERLVDIEKNRRRGVKDFSAQAVFFRLCEIIENYKLLKLTEESEYPAREDHIAAEKGNSAEEGEERR